MADTEREGWIPYDGTSRPVTDVALSDSASTHSPPIIDASPAEGRASVAGRRFRLIYAGLGVIAALGVAALVLLVVREPGTTAAAGSNWADFSPGGSAYAKAQDIANHVSSKYKGAGGTQLVGAIAGPPLITSNQPEGSSQILVSTVAITPDNPAGGGQSNRDVVLLGVDGRNSIQYVLCGYGENCSIAKGEPSVERHTLLRREALELALFTFHEMKSIDSVSIFLPPRPDGSAAPTMVFFQRDDLATQLARPLDKTLTPDAPGIGKIPTDELDTVNRLTQNRLYQYNYTQAQDGSAVMLLDPVVT